MEKDKTSEGEDGMRYFDKKGITIQIILYTLLILCGFIMGLNTKGG